MNDVVLSLDVDWAPDFVINAVAEMLIESQVRATWFITHSSPAIDRLRNHSHLFELGIHPNFLPGSTQGSSPTEVLRHCMELVPDATTMRTHSAVQSGPLLATVLKETPVRADVSLFLPEMSHIVPVGYELGDRRLTRVPAFWEDCYQMRTSQPCWNSRDRLEMFGLKVFSFHPIHVYLNMTDFSIYSRIKRAGSLQTLSTRDVNPYIQPGVGPQTAFRDLIDLLAPQGDSLRICDVVELHQNGEQKSRGTRE